MRSARPTVETGGSVLELGEAEYIVRASGYLQSLDDFRQIPLTAAPPASRCGSAMSREFRWTRLRRGIGELDGEGEATGGVIVMRSGQERAADHRSGEREDAIAAASLPKGVEIVPVYDRSGLIERAVDNLTVKLIEEFLVVAVVCSFSCFTCARLRCDRLAAARHPRGFHRDVLPGRQRQHHVAGRHCDRHWSDGRCGGRDDRKRAQAPRALEEEHPGEQLEGEARWQVIGDAAAEVGPALFSLC